MKRDRIAKRPARSVPREASSDSLRAVRGFTLLEVVVAVGFAAFLAATVYGVIVETLSLSRATSEGMELEREGRMVVDLLARDLAGLPKYMMDGRVERFSARLDRELPLLDFVSAGDSLAVPSRAASDLTEVGWRLSLRDDDTGLFLLYRREDFFVDARPLEGGTLSVVSDRVKGLALEYKGGSVNDAWTDTWSDLGSGAPPAAVRVTLTLARPRPPGDGGGGFLEEKTFETILETRSW